VAAGRFDGYWEKRMNPWDISAGMVILREAGGYVTDEHGKDTGVPRLIVASNNLIHNEMLAVLRDGDNAPLP
jgi:myo-inositol-1(or 4)-monophosphatase